MQSPANLRVFREAEDLAVSVYALAKLLPIDERFALAQQLRRAAVSVGSNIAEGCGRGGGSRELIRFLSIALGSATELEFQLRLVLRMEYADGAACESVIGHTQRVQRMLTSLIVRIRPASEASRGRP